MVDWGWPSQIGSFRHTTPADETVAEGKVIACYTDGKRLAIRLTRLLGHGRWRVEVLREGQVWETIPFQATSVNPVVAQVATVALGYTLPGWRRALAGLLAWLGADRWGRAVAQSPRMRKVREHRAQEFVSQTNAMLQAVDLPPLTAAQMEDLSAMLVEEAEQ